MQFVFEGKMSGAVLMFSLFGEHTRLYWHAPARQQPPTQAPTLPNPDLSVKHTLTNEGFLRHIA